MKPVLAGSLGCLFLALAACDALGSTTKSVAPSSLPTPAAPSTPTTPDMPAVPTAAEFDLGKLLGGVTDGASAEAAKGPLETGIGALKKALAGADAKAKLDGAAGGNTDTAGTAKKMASDVLAKFGLGAGTVDSIAKLLDNPAVKSAIGPMLEQLQGMIPAM